MNKYNLKTADDVIKQLGFEPEKLTADDENGTVYDTEDWEQVEVIKRIDPDGYVTYSIFKDDVDTFKSIHIITGADNIVFYAYDDALVK